MRDHRIDFHPHSCRTSTPTLSPKPAGAGRTASRCFRAGASAMPSARWIGLAYGPGCSRCCRRSHFDDAVRVRIQSQRLNGEAARLVRPIRTGSASLRWTPLPDMEGAIEEARHALDVFGAEAVVFETNHHGVISATRCWDRSLPSSTGGRRCCSSNRPRRPAPTARRWRSATRADAGVHLRDHALGDQPDPVRHDERFRGLRFIVPHVERPFGCC